MIEKEEWIPLSWHCPNCGTIVTGYKNKTGIAKAECGRCHSVMVCTHKSKTHECIDIYAPKGR